MDKNITKKGNKIKLPAKSNKKNNELEQVKAELIAVNQKLIDSEKMKSHFISNVSNELVNPFTSILGLSKSILEVKKENWKKVVTMVSMIHSEAFNLDFQLKNIIAAARIEAGEILPEISDIEIKGLILDTLERFKYEAKKKELLINCTFHGKKKNDGYYFKSDSEKIRLIVSNLISNAIKFSFPKGKVEVNITFKKNILTLTVQDFGTGISEKNKAIIFNRFNQSDSGINSTNRGHGLGLSINKAFIDILNGNISFKTAAGKGTTFEVTIPCSKGTINGVMLDGNELLFKEDSF